MYSTHDKGESVVTEIFIRTLKNKIYKYMTLISKNKLDDIINRYNNTYHRTIKINPVAVNDSTYIDHSVESNDNDPKFEINDHMKISKYKNIFGKAYTTNWSEVLIIRKVKKNCIIDISY